MVRGAEMVTVGAAREEFTIQLRSELRRSDWPALSMAVALTFHSPSVGTVTSYDHVAFVAPTTSGVARKLWKAAPTVPSSCRYRLAASRKVSVIAFTPL